MLYLGSMVRVRRLETIVRAFRQSARSRSYGDALLRGRRESVRHRLSSRGGATAGIAERVVFTGALPREEAFAYVRAADVCLSPIYPTPILDVASPTKLVEYMALGETGHRQRAPRANAGARRERGWIARAVGRERFAEAMISLLTNPGLAAEMGRKGRAYVARHRCYSVIAEHVEGAYRSRLRL